MKHKCRVAVALTMFFAFSDRPVEANQTVLPGSIQIAFSGRDIDPAAAFNTVDKTWLIVWRETSPGSLSNSSVLGRVVREDRTILTAPVNIGGGAGVTPPRVAHDPIRNEWMVVFGSGPAFDEGIYTINARKVAANGALIGASARGISAGNVGEAFPDVAAGRVENTVFVEPPTPFFLAVWQQTVAAQPAIVARRLFEDAADPTHVGFNAAVAPFRVDVGADLPTDRVSTRPRITERGPFGTASGAGGNFRRETHPRVAFELQSAGQKDVYMADVNAGAVFGVLKVAGSTDAEDAPEIAWNEQTNRTLVLYRKAGTEIFAQLTETSPTAPFHALLGAPFRVTAGSASTVAAQAGTDIFLASAFNSGSFGLGCIAGGRVVGTPAAGAANGDQLALSPSTAGNVTLLFRRADATGATIIRASILVVPPPAIPNNAPIARAGSDIEVAEGALFSLDGSTSSDTNGDPVRFKWSRTDAGNPGDFFIAPAEQVKAKPQLLAPLLGPAGTPIDLTFQLGVDDFRISPVFSATDAVVVRVVPGADLNPPSANAGADRTVDEGAIAQLDGSASSDPDNDPLSFSWTLVDVQPPLVAPGSVAIGGADTAQPTFTSPRFANPSGLDLRFKLTVTTPRGGKDEDEVLVHVDDSISEAPIANAGADLTGALAVSEGTPFQLDGSASSDPNGDAMTFKWELVGVLSFNGNLRETLEIVGGDTATPAITAALFNERDIEFRLTVRDLGGLDGVDQVVVRVKEVPMAITSVVPPAGSPGTRVAIRGVNLASPDTRVFFGAEDLIHTGRIEAMTDNRIDVLVPAGGPSRFRTFVESRHLHGVLIFDYHDVKSAPITVRKGGERVVTPQPFEVSHLEITEAFLNQGLESYPLIQGKATVLHIRVRTALGGPQLPLPGLSPAPTGATCTAFPAGGASFQIVPTNVPTSALANTAKATRIGETVNFHLDPSQTLVPTYRFSAFLYHNGIEVAAIRTDLESSVFTPTFSPRILAVHMVPFKNGGIDPAWTAADQATHQGKVDAAFAAFARIYPFSFMESQESIVYLPNPLELPDLIQDDGKLHMEQFGFTENFLLRQLCAINELGDTLDSYNGDHPNARAQVVVAMIADRLYAAGATGFAVPPNSMMADIVRFTILQNVGPVDDLLESVLGFITDVTCVATAGLFCKDPVDILVDIVLGLIEAFGFDVTGKISFVIADSSSGDTLAQEVGHNLGFVNPFSPEHDGANVSHSLFDEDNGLTFFSAPSTEGPVLNPVKSESQLFNSGNRAKSVMSYAPSKSNENAFFEPSQYRKIFDIFRTDNAGGAGGADLAGGGGPPGGADSTLRISGVYSFHEETLQIGEARPGLPSEPLTPEAQKSVFTLAFLNAAGQLLAEKGLSFNVQIPVHGHGADGEDGDRPEVYAYFRVVQEVPAGTARGELRFQGKVLWTRSALGSAPTLQLLAPAGGEDVAPEAELLVRWLSVDVDGDELTHTVSYSSDGGATFTPLAVGVRANELRWATSAVAGTDTAVVKVVAFDGFHASEAISAPFRLGGGKPSVTILAPTADGHPISSRPVPLAGLARPAGGSPVTDDAAYQWSSSVAGLLGTGRNVLAEPLAPGAHRIRLEVAVGGVAASSEVEITVLSDRDGDGVDDATEAANGLNPDDPEDLFRDDDGDGVATGAEVLDFDSDPAKADTDGDGISDGDEVENGTSPTKKDTDGDGLDDPADNCPLALNADQADADADGLGDSCDPEAPPEAPVLRRGDPNGDGEIDLTDAVSLLSHLFLGGIEPVCLDAADANDDGGMDISDAVATLGYLFLGADALPSPGSNSCGVDPTTDQLQRCAYPEEACR